MLDVVESIWTDELSHETKERINDSVESWLSGESFDPTPQFLVENWLRIENG